MREILIRCLNHHLSLDAYLVLDCLYNEEKTGLLAYASTVKKISNKVFNTLIDREYIVYSGTGDPPKYTLDNITLTNKFEEHVLGIRNTISFEDAFQELLDTYPKKTPGGRRLHTDMARCKKLYMKEVVKKKVVDESLHSLFIQCTRFMLSEKRRSGSMDYLQLLPTFLSKREWETVKEDVEMIIAKGGFVGQRSIQASADDENKTLIGGEFE